MCVCACVCVCGDDGGWLRASAGCVHSKCVHACHHGTKKGAKGEPCFELNSAKWREVGFKNEAVAYFKTLT